MNDKLNEVFNLNNTEIVEVKPKELVVVDTEYKDVTHEVAIRDFEDSRDKLTDILDVGARSVQDLATLAATSQLPEHYAALSSLLKNVSEVASLKLKLHDQLQKIKEKDNSGETKENHSHLHFHGSTMELASMLKKKNNEET